MQTDLRTDTTVSIQSQQISNYLLDNNTLLTNNCEYNCKTLRAREYVESESELFGLNQKINKLPIENPDSLIPSKQVSTNNPRDEIKFLFETTNQNTKLSKSCDILADITIDRFELPHHDPQSQILESQLTHPIDSRIFHKDSKKIICNNK